jgi:hypothetical protein
MEQLKFLIALAATVIKTLIEERETSIAEWDQLIADVQKQRDETAAQLAYADDCLESWFVTQEGISDQLSAANRNTIIHLLSNRFDLYEDMVYTLRQHERRGEQLQKEMIDKKTETINTNTKHLEECVDYYNRLTAIYTALYYLS